MRLLVHLVYISSLVFCLRSEPGLISVQVLFRHGDRTPLETTVNDPYQESFWGLPWGTLTTLGMEQQYQNGLKLKARYIDQYKLVNATYSSKETIVFSAHTDRCLQSAAANLAGFYSDSAFHPSSKIWPNNWTPVPIHQNQLPDHEYEPGTDCLRVDELYARRALHNGFIDFQAQHAELLLTIAEHSGDKPGDFKRLVRFFDTIICESDHNLTLPAWITPQLFNECMSYMEQTEDYINGMAGFGQPDDTEMLRLRGGPMLQNIIASLSENAGHKYYVNSAHDSTVAALLYTLGAKNAAVGKKNPDYAATIVFELWKMDDGTLSVKVLYSANAEDSFHTITKAVTGCPNYDFCPVPVFVKRSQQYLPTNIVKECERIF